MPRQEKPGGSFLNVTHHFPVPAITDVILRDCSWIKDAVLKSGSSAHAQQNTQIFASQLEQFFRRERGQLRITLASDIACKGQVPGGRAVRKEGRRKNRSQNFESLDPGN